MLALAGGAFTWLMWRSFERALDQGEWDSVPCRIVRSEVLERKLGPEIPEEFGFGVAFEYEVSGATHRAETYSLRGTAWSHRREPAEALKEMVPVDSAQTCHVNPDDPAQAVLKIDSKGPGYSLWFPLLFVVGGVVMMANALRVFFKSGRSA